MGKFDFEIDPAFLRSLGKLAEVEKYAPQMIDAATPILEKNIKSALAGHRRTGTMVNSVKRTRAKKAKNGTYLATVRPTGMSRKYIDKHGKRFLRRVDKAFNHCVVGVIVDTQKEFSICQ